MSNSNKTFTSNEPIVKEQSVYLLEISKEAYDKVEKLADYNTLMRGPFGKDMYLYQHRLYTTKFTPKGIEYYQVSFDSDITIDKSLL